MLNIGCGGRKISCAVNADINKFVRPDIVCNLNDGLPFKDGTFDTVVASQILEHLGDTEFVMAEIWRVLKHGGKVVISCTFAGHPASFQNDHIRFFRPRDFTLYNGTTSSTLKCRFRIVSVRHTHGYTFKLFPLWLAGIFMEKLLNSSKRIETVDKYACHVAHFLPMKEFVVIMKKELLKRSFK